MHKDQKNFCTWLLKCWQQLHWCIMWMDAWSLAFKWTLQINRRYLWHLLWGLWKIMCEAATWVELTVWSGSHVSHHLYIQQVWLLWRKVIGTNYKKFLLQFATNTEEDTASMCKENKACLCDISLRRICKNILIWTRLFYDVFDLNWISL